MHSSNVVIDRGNGHAVYQATDLAMPDYHDAFNALTGGPFVPGVVTFRLEWAESREKHRYHDVQDRWGGHLVQTSVKCTWSGNTATTEFHTDTLNPTIFAEVGQEKSGVFFH